MSRARFAIGMSTAAAVATALGVMAAPAAGAGTHGHGAGFVVIASHLNNPRGLSRAPDGGLYLAEAGAGGKSCVSGGPEGNVCPGLTGSFDLITNGHVKRIVTGLISFSDTGGVAAEGPVSVSRAPRGSFYGLFGGNTHAVPPKGAIPDRLRNKALAQLGRLWLVKPGGSVKIVANVGDQDWAWSKRHIDLAPKDFPDANPNAVLFSHGSRYVADAGANTLVRVKWNGNARVLDFFHVPANYQSDAVATCVARGPDGVLYVGELLGGFYSPGHARIWRVTAHHARVWARGLTTVQGCGFGSDGASMPPNSRPRGWAPRTRPGMWCASARPICARTLALASCSSPPASLPEPTARSTCPTAASPPPQAWAHNCAPPVARWSASG